MCELLKLPKLVQHYTEHKKQNHTLSFIQFLDIHYMHGSPRDADYDKDMQLPFKMLTNSSLSLVVHVAPVPQTFSFTEKKYPEKKQNMLSHSSPYSSNYFSSIWQPPRI